METIVEFILTVYNSMWFTAKIHHHLTNGPYLVLKQINLINDFIKPAAKILSLLMSTAVLGMLTLNIFY